MKHSIALAAALLLLSGSVRAQVPAYRYSRVDHYLGRGDRMMKQYRFAEAAANYLKAREVLRDTSRIAEITDRQMFAQNAISMMGYCSTPAVVARKTVPLSQFYLYYPLQDGGWRPCPNQLDSAAAHPFADALYLPDGQEQYYYSAADETGSRDIYFTERHSAAWARPSLLGESLVSARDEIFPYLSQDGRTLYFASNGLQGVGGYDLYTTTWDPETREWSAPVNMGYPYSSPADDFFLIHSDDGRYTLFASNRACAPDSVVIYVLEYEAVPSRKTVFSEEELQQLMALEPTGKRPEPAADPAAGENPQIRRYREAAARAEQLKGEMAESEKALSELRARYARADFEARGELAAEIMEREERIPALTDSLHAAYRSMQEIEEALAAEGIPAAQLLTPAKAGPKSAFVFEKRSFGPPVPFEFEQAGDFDYSFMVLNEGRFAKDNTLPDGVVYQIQLFSSPAKAGVEALNGLSPVFERTSAGRYFYSVGVFRTYQDVLRSLNRVKRLGFRDAYITAYIDSKPVQVPEARSAEKQ